MPLDAPVMSVTWSVKSIGAYFCIDLINHGNNIASGYFCRTFTTEARVLCFKMKQFPGPRVKMKLANTPCGPRRVAITGIGAVAPNGVGVAAYRAALHAGASGVAAISLFDPAGLDCGIAAEIKHLPIDQYLTPPEARRVGRAVPLLLAAAQEALARAGVCAQHLSPAEKQSWGVVIGSGGGTADFTEEQYRLFFPIDCGGSAPTTFRAPLPVVCPANCPCASASAVRAI